MGRVVDEDALGFLRPDVLHPVDVPPGVVLHPGGYPPLLPGEAEWGEAVREAQMQGIGHPTQTPLTFVGVGGLSGPHRSGPPKGLDEVLHALAQMGGGSGEADTTKFPCCTIRVHQTLQQGCALRDRGKHVLVGDVLFVGHLAPQTHSHQCVLQSMGGLCLRVHAPPLVPVVM